MRVRPAAIAALLALLVSASAAQDPPKRIRVSADLLARNLQHRVEPEYPAQALEYKLRGIVRLSVIIAADGSVKQAEVLSGHPLFVPPAMEAVKQWRYRPTLVNGEAIEVVSTVEVSFGERAGAAADSLAGVEERARVNPEDPQAQFGLAMARVSQGDLDAAVAALRRVLDLEPGHSRARRELVITLLQRKRDPEAAAAELRMWVQRDPNDAAARRQLANVLIDIDDVDGAIAELVEFSRLPEQLFDGCRDLTAALLMKRAPERAATEMRRMAPHCGKDAAEMHSAIGEALLRRMRFSSAVRQFEEASRLKPDDDKLRRRLQEFKQIQGAMSCMQQQLTTRATEDLPAALTLAGVRFMLDDNRETALAAIREVFRKTDDPGVMEFVSELGPLLAQMGGTSFAIAEMEKFRQLRPEVDSIQVGVAQLLLTRGRLDEAAGAAQQALAMNPRNARAHGIRGSVFTARGQLEDARAEQQAEEKMRLEEQQNPQPQRVNPFQNLEAELARCEPAGITDSRMTANETSAVGSLRSLNTANVQYLATYERGFPTSLAALGPGDPASAEAADLIDSVLASGTKSGYTFIYITGQTNEKGHIQTYSITADPVEPGKTGSRWFYTDQSGVIRFSTTGRAGPADQPIS